LHLSKRSSKLSSNEPHTVIYVFFSHDVVNIKLSDKPEWYFERNPLGKVPAIETESGDCLYESLIIADYLDEKYPETPLQPKDPMQKAKDRILVEHFSKVGITVIFLLLLINC
jgi:glutathione S-transferase